MLQYIVQVVAIQDPSNLSIRHSPQRAAEISYRCASPYLIVLAAFLHDNVVAAAAAAAAAAVVMLALSCVYAEALHKVQDRKNACRLQAR